MKSFLLGFLALGLLNASLPAQDLPKIRKQMQAIPGGAFLMGDGYAYTVSRASMTYVSQAREWEADPSEELGIGDLPPFNHMGEATEVAPFRISTREVTNLQYRQFLVDMVYEGAAAERFWDLLKTSDKDGVGRNKKMWSQAFAKAADKGLLQDTACWTSEFVFAYNEPLSQNYHWHPAFDEYPVVGVSRSQAEEYCTWLSQQNNRDLQERGKPLQAPFRLPTEAEWECAAQGPVQTASDGLLLKPVFPWEGRYVWNDKGEFRANVKTGPREYIGDNYEYTAPVGTFAPNPYGLYNVAGNVAEWVAEDAVISVSGDGMPGREGLLRPFGMAKGGSWADNQYAALIGSRALVVAERGHSRVGFRIAQSVD